MRSKILCFLFGLIAAFNAYSDSVPAPRLKGASLFSTVTTSCTSTNLCAVAYAGENFDNGNYHDNVTNNSRITIPQSTGKFQCSATVAVSLPNALATTIHEWRLYIRVDGTIYIAVTKDQVYYQSAAVLGITALSVTSPVMSTSGFGYAEAVFYSDYSGNTVAVANNSNTAAINRLACWSE